jgi:hypothetical protein
MKPITLISKRGQKYTVSMPNPKADFISAYIFAFTKSGSTLLNNMVAAYCQYIDVPTFSLFGAAFEQGIHTQHIQEDALVCFKKTGYIYTGFRHFPGFDLDVTGAPAILLTRDPRDMLVSLYYSVLKSHLIPRGLESFKLARKATESIDINEFVIKKADYLAMQFKRYKNSLAGSDLKVYRYEDVIYEKEEWLADVVGKLGVRYDHKHLVNIAKHFDVIPDTENENEHVRQVHPGDHTKKLTPETIQELNKLLSGFLAYFDYEN